MSLNFLHLLLNADPPFHVWTSDEETSMAPYCVEGPMASSLVSRQLGDSPRACFLSFFFAQAAGARCAQCAAGDARRAGYRCADCLRCDALRGMRCNALRARAAMHGMQCNALRAGWLQAAPCFLAMLFSYAIEGFLGWEERV